VNASGSEVEVSVPSPWYSALLVVARHKPWAHWQMTYDTAFWWRPSASELLAEGFATRPFAYAEIASVRVFDRGPETGVLLSEKWIQLREALLSVKGLVVREERDIALPPVARPANLALHLTLGEVS